MAHFLQALLNASEKAANIARACRHEQELFKLLVQEKKNEEKNIRFALDFKTLADVLIQETVKYDLGTKFPAIAKHIKGEESNMFTNTLGESIYVEVLANEEETSALLCRVLDGDKHAADLLSREVHKKVEVEEDLSCVNLPESLPIDELGVWIDPIDSTFEYIQGEPCEPVSGIHANGLRCVTVLIGSYIRQSGVPIIGVVNQPFHEETSSSIWTGRKFWGVSFEDIVCTSLSSKVSEQAGIALISSSEGPELRERLSKKYQLVEAAGAGYKQLCVALGLADVYVLSRGTTYRWDVCGPHALLKASGGGVVSFAQLSATPLSQLPDDVDRKLGIKYNKEGTKGWSNDEGIVVFANRSCLVDVLAAMQL